MVVQEGEFIEVFLLPFAGLYSALVVCKCIASLMCSGSVITSSARWPPWDLLMVGWSCSTVVVLRFCEEQALSVDA